jgi:hypothetical protein
VSRCDATWPPLGVLSRHMHTKSKPPLGVLSSSVSYAVLPDCAVAGACCRVLSMQVAQVKITNKDESSVTNHGSGAGGAAAAGSLRMSTTARVRVACLPCPACLQCNIPKDYMLSIVKVQYK